MPSVPQKKTTQNGPAPKAKPQATVDKIDPSLQALIRPVEGLEFDPMNARLHPEGNIEDIKASLTRYGQRSPIVVDRATGHVMKGNGTLRAARELGWTRIAAAEQDFADQVEAVGYGVADNRTGESSKWDFEVLARLDRIVQEGGGQDIIGWTEEELTNLRTTDWSPAVTGEETSPVPVKPENPIPKRGDVWQLGRHRLMCGDATSKKDVDLLLGSDKPFIMVTDPPYGVEYDPKWRQEAAEQGLLAFARRRLGEVQNDTRIDWSEAYKLFPGDVVYCWHAGRHASEVQMSLEISGFIVRSQIIWVKDGFVISRGHYHWEHEPCWYAVRDGAAADWAGDRSQSTAWRISKKNTEEKTNHGTQKPLECMERPLRHHGNEATVAYDPFVGTGTTIIAAERARRKCLAMDLDEGYVHVALERWLNFSGIDPVRQDGARFSELKKKAPGR